MPDIAEMPHETNENDGSSSIMQVSQSVLQPSISPVLKKYRKYLQSCYEARPIASADKYLPTLDAPYINLAIVSKSLEQKDEFTRQTLHGGVDQILESKTPVNIEDLLTPKDSGRPVRFILVEGPPGIGKSTFAWEVCRRWDKIENLRDYHTVVLLKLREKWVFNATSLSDLFRYPSERRFRKKIAMELDDSHGHNLLLVLDGFDEVSHSFHENSIIKSILCRELLPECTIILTTRPSAKSMLKDICQPRVNKHVEIIGFTEEERVRYITEVFSTKKELQANFLKYMFHVPHIKSMMYIPLNCSIIAQVYYESQSSCHLAIPRTRTQLYKALTHSLLARHMKMKESKSEYVSVLPDGLNKSDMDNFKTLAKFAFDSYHQGKLKKVTFFKEDIPEGLVHFGFMNESSEMYASRGVERTFSFLHLSLQEYLAAWHLASSYSIEFQVAYHRLAVDGSLMYKGDNKEEEALISSLKGQRSSVVDPALFLAGITGWRCQSEDDRNHWETYLSHDTTKRTTKQISSVLLHFISSSAVLQSFYGFSVLLQSLYEAQNDTLIPHYFAAECTNENRGVPSSDISRTNISVGSSVTPYLSYAISYCLAHSSAPFSISISIPGENEVSCLETFIKGLHDHYSVSTPHVKVLKLYSNEHLNICLSWIKQVKFLHNLEEFHFNLSVKCPQLQCFLKLLVKLRLLDIKIDSSTSWEWLAALNSLSELKVLQISSLLQCNPPPTDLLCSLIEHRLTEFVLDIIITSLEKTKHKTVKGLCGQTDVLYRSVLNSVLRSDQITELVLSYISRETMAGVHSVLLHCPSLVTLELKEARLGYDGILFICSALKHNTTLRNLAVIESVLIFDLDQPSKTTCTEFLLELNNYLEDNAALEEVKFQSGLFNPLPADVHDLLYGWRGVEPLQQFNMGAVGSGISPNLKRSFSSSDLTHPETHIVKEKMNKAQILQRSVNKRRGLLLRKNQYPRDDQEQKIDIDFKQLFSKRKEKRESCLSFTAPDTDILQSFSGLDPRLKKYLEISHLQQYVENLSKTYFRMLREVAAIQQI